MRTNDHRIDAIVDRIGNGFRANVRQGRTFPRRRKYRTSPHGFNVLFAGGYLVTESHRSFRVRMMKTRYYKYPSVQDHRKSPLSGNNVVYSIINWWTPVLC